MAIDSNIAMGVQPMKIDSPMNALAQILQVQNAQQANQLGSMTMQHKQQEYDDTNKLNSFYTGALGADGKIDRAALYKNVASGGLGSKIPGLQKGFMDTDKAQGDVDAQKFKLASERHAIYQKSLGILAQEPSLSKDMVMQAGQSLVQQGILPAEMFQQSVASLPDDPVQLRARLTQGMKSQLTPEQIFTVFSPKPEKLDNGGQISFRDTNPNSPTYGQATGGAAVAKVQSPDSVASNATTQRGQNMTAGTAAAGREQSAAQFGVTHAAGKVSPGYRANPDGSWMAIAGGPADLKINAAGVAKKGDAHDVLGLLDEVDKLLPKATGSYVGAGVDSLAGAVGYGTQGAASSAQLKALEGALISKMPKMSGPQSDKDVLLYRQMAGEVGDPTIPTSRRQAAANMVRKLHEKYAGMAEGASRSSNHVDTLLDKYK